VDGLDVAGEVLRLDDRYIVAADRRHRRRFPLRVRDLEAAAIRFGRLESLSTGTGLGGVSKSILHTHLHFS
jgi:hypothetical protein